MQSLHDLIVGSVLRYKARLRTSHLPFWDIGCYIYFVCVNVCTCGGHSCRHECVEVRGEFERLSLHHVV